MVGIDVLPPGCRAIPAGHLNLDPKVVEAFGGSKVPSAVTKAIIYQKVLGWIEHNRRAGHNHRNGENWSYNTYRQWTEEIRIFHQKTIEKHIRDMEALGLFSTQEFDASWGNRRKYYASPMRLSDDLSQMLLWSESMTPMVGALGSDITIKNPTKKQPSTNKRQSTAKTGTRKTLNAAGAVASFQTPRENRELPEKTPSTAETRPASNEGDYALALEGAPDKTDASQTSPSSAPPPSDLAGFFNGCTDDELQELLQKYGEDRLRHEMHYALKAPDITNPPGFALSQLMKFPHRPTPMPSMAGNYDWAVNRAFDPHLDTTAGDTSSAPSGDYSTETDSDETPAPDVPVDSPEAKAWASLQWCIHEQTYTAYVQRAKLLRVEGSVWTIRAENAYALKQLQHPRLIIDIQRALAFPMKVAPESIDLRFELAQKAVA